MTKKDYIALAAALREERPSPDEKQKLMGWTAAVNAISRVLQRDNPQFSSLRFIRAIVLGQEGA